MNSIKKLFHKQLSETKDNRSITNWFIIVSVICSIITVVLETEITISQLYQSWFVILNLWFALIFTLEYMARLWVCDLDQKYLGQGWKGRIRYMKSPMAVIDLIALVPFYLAFIPESFLLRLFRLLRLLSLAKFGRYSEALQEIVQVIYGMRYTLFVSFCISILVVFFAATGMYMIEGDIQPEHFGSIPRALWWAEVTLSTIGYGDVYPVTLLGKIFAGIYTLGTISIVGLPAAILAGGFATVFQKRNINEEKQ